MRIYTLGYQAIYLNTFIEALKSESVGTLIDVRAVPWSRREEFSKRNLEVSLTVAGLKYVHLERAGNPAVKDRPRGEKSIYPNYRAYVEANPEVLDEVMLHIENAGGLVCLMCKESNPAHCHRSELVNTLVEKFPRLESAHLMVGAHRDTESGFLPFMETGVLRVLSSGQRLMQV